MIKEGELIRCTSCNAVFTMVTIQKLGSCYRCGGMKMSTPAWLSEENTWKMKSREADLLKNQEKNA
jgi:predicted  nucleic acid-binding Zn-ribbon protein